MTKDSDLTSSPVVSLVNLSASQEKENQRKMTEISGKKLLELSKSPDLLFLLEKMLMESLNSISTPYSRIWKAQITQQKHLISALKASVLPTKEKESGLLRTPTTQDSRIGMNNIGGHQHRMKRGSTALADQILFPTPTAGNSMNVVMPPEFVKRNSSGWTVTRKGTGTKFGAKLNDVVNYLEKPKTGWRLNPNFVERLMGFPMDWTKIESTESKLSETQSFHKSHTTSDKS